MEGKEVEVVGATGAPGIPGSLPWRPGPGEVSPNHVQLHIWTVCAQQRVTHPALNSWPKP